MFKTKFIAGLLAIAAINHFYGTENDMDFAGDAATGVPCTITSKRHPSAETERQAQGCGVAVPKPLHREG